MTATVTAEVWILPPASVVGTRWTRWPPDSYFRLSYASGLLTEKIISLYPPMPVELTLRYSIFQPFMSA